MVVLGSRRRRLSSTVVAAVVFGAVVVGAARPGSAGTLPPSATLYGVVRDCAAGTATAVLRDSFPDTRDQFVSLSSLPASENEVPNAGRSVVTLADVPKTVVGGDVVWGLGTDTGDEPVLAGGTVHLPDCAPVPPHGDGGGAYDPGFGRQGSVFLAGLKDAVGVVSGSDQQGLSCVGVTFEVYSIADCVTANGKLTVERVGGAYPMYWVGAYGTDTLETLSDDGGQIEQDVGQPGPDGGYVQDTAYVNGASNDDVFAGAALGPDRQTFFALINGRVGAGAHSTLYALDSEGSNPLFDAGGAHPGALQIPAMTVTGVASNGGDVTVAGIAYDRLRISQYTLAGTIDTGFGKTGSVYLKLGLPGTARVTAGHAGELYVTQLVDTPSGVAPAVTRLLADGQIDPSWGQDGTAVGVPIRGGQRVPHTVASVAVDSHGQAYLTIRTAGYPYKTLIQEVGPNGPVTAFGDSGQVSLNGLPGSHFSDIAPATVTLNALGQLIVAGVVPEDSDGHGKAEILRITTH